MEVMVTTSRQRWRIRLVEEQEPLPLVPYAEPEPEGETLSNWPELSSIAALLAALVRVTRRAEGPGAWGAPLAEDPVAFLLDAIEEVVNVWDASGRLLFSNRPGTDLGWPGSARVERVTQGGSRYDRRCLDFTLPSGRYLIEVISRVQ
jgi:hypothetical protein